MGGNHETDFNDSGRSCSSPFLFFFSIRSLRESAKSAKCLSPRLSDDRKEVQLEGRRFIEEIKNSIENQTVETILHDLVESLKKNVPSSPDEIEDIEELHDQDIVLAQDIAVACFPALWPMLEAVRKKEERIKKEREREEAKPLIAKFRAEFRTNYQELYDAEMIVRPWVSDLGFTVGQLFECMIDSRDVWIEAWKLGDQYVVRLHRQISHFDFTFRMYGGKALLTLMTASNVMQFQAIDDWGPLLASIKGSVQTASGPSSSVQQGENCMRGFRS
jgi:hypothetical protein